MRTGTTNRREIHFSMSAKIDGAFAEIIKELESDRNAWKHQAEGNRLAYFDLLREKLPTWIPMSTPPTKEDSTPIGEVLFSFGYCISLATWDRKAWAAGIPPTHWMRIPPLPKPPQPQKKLISCDCSCADKCPQGKMGSEMKCQIWVK